MSWEDKTEPNRVVVFECIIKGWRIEAQWDVPGTSFCDSSVCPQTWLVRSNDLRLGTPRWE